MILALVLVAGASPSASVRATEVNEQIVTCGLSTQARQRDRPEVMLGSNADEVTMIVLAPNLDVEKQTCLSDWALSRDLLVAVVRE